MDTYLKNPQDQGGTNKPKNQTDLNKSTDIHRPLTTSQSGNNIPTQTESSNPFFNNKLDQKTSDTNSGSNTMFSNRQDNLLQEQNSPKQIIDPLSKEDTQIVLD